MCPTMRRSARRTIARIDHGASAGDARSRSRKSACTSRRSGQSGGTRAPSSRDASRASPASAASRNADESGTRSRRALSITAASPCTATRTACRRRRRPAASARTSRGRSALRRSSSSRGSTVFVPHWKPGPSRAEATGAPGCRHSHGGTRWLSGSAQRPRFSARASRSSASSFGSSLYLRYTHAAPRRTSSAFTSRSSTNTRASNRPWLSFPWVSSRTSRLRTSAANASRASRP